MSEVECWPFVRVAQERVVQEKQVVVATLPSQHVFRSLRRKEAKQHTEAKLFEMQLKLNQIQYENTSLKKRLEQLDLWYYW